MNNNEQLNMEGFSIECRKSFRNCFGLALLRFVIG